MEQADFLKAKAAGKVEAVQRTAEESGADTPPPALDPESSPIIADFLPMLQDLRRKFRDGTAVTSANGHAHDGGSQTIASGIPQKVTLGTSDFANGITFASSRFTCV